MVFFSVTCYFSLMLFITCEKQKQKWCQLKIFDFFPQMFFFFFSFVVDCFRTCPHIKRDICPYGLDCCVNAKCTHNLYLPSRNCFNFIDSFFLSYLKPWMQQSFQQPGSITSSFQQNVALDKSAGLHCVIGSGKY